MRLPVSPLASVGRRLDRRQRVALVALAGAATVVGMAAGSSDRDAEHPSRPAAAEAAGVRAPVSAAAANGASEGRGGRPRRGGAAYYRRTARGRVPARAAEGFLPLYREAARRYGVNWRLIASIHRQETAFSTAPSTYHGRNALGCCAGPMQFNVTNGPVSTWKRYRWAFRDGRRPESYPHRTRSHPSIYDDFDAIMAAGSLLSDSGAGPLLDVGAWSAAYNYYGHDLFGVTYANEVLARAVAWERDGFCANCGLDEGLVAEFDDAYGAPVRRQLLAAERRRRKRERGRHHKVDRHDRQGRRRRGGDGGLSDRAAKRSPAPARPLSPPPAAEKYRPPKPPPPRPRQRRPGRAKPSPPPTPTQPSTPPPTTPPGPPDGGCDPINKLLGC